MNAGQLDRRIDLLKAGEAVDDGYTTKPGELESQGTRWARYIPAMAREVFENAGREAKMPVVFEVRSDSLTRQITEQWVIEYNGTRYDIEGVQEIGRKDGIRIQAVAGDEG